VTTTSVILDAAQQLSSHHKELHDLGQITLHGLVVGQVVLRRGCLCQVDTRGRLVVGAPRRADVVRARRVAAIVNDLAESAGRRRLEGTVVGVIDDEGEERR